MTILVRVFALPVPFPSLLLALSLTHEKQHETKIYGGGRSGGEGGYRGRGGKGGGGQCGSGSMHGAYSCDQNGGCARAFIACT